MRVFTIIILFGLFSCSTTENNDLTGNQKMTFNEADILEQLDLGFNESPSEYFPKGGQEDIKYNFFLDLEHSYCETAGNRIHLYSDSTKWVIVFEKSGYFNRGATVDIELNYFGNCIDYPIDEYPERNYISNTARITLIDSDEFERIENKKGLEMETFELIGKNIKKIKVRELYVPFDNDYKNYENVEIKIREDDNPNNLIGFGELVRYLHETNPDLIKATEEEIQKHIPADIPKIMTIEDFHFVSSYDKSKPPSQQETYILIAKILKTRDATNWKPTLKANNSWKNWESGNL